MIKILEGCFIKFISLIRFIFAAFVILLFSGCVATSFKNEEGFIAADSFFTVEDISKNQLNNKITLEGVAGYFPNKSASPCLWMINEKKVAIAVISKWPAHLAGKYIKIQCVAKENTYKPIENSRPVQLRAPVKNEVLLHNVLLVDRLGRVSELSERQRKCCRRR